MEPKRKKLETINVLFDTKLEFDRLTNDMKAQKGSTVGQDEATRNLIEGYKSWKSHLAENSRELELTFRNTNDKIHVRPDHEEWFRRLHFILESGHVENMALAQESLKLFERLLKAEGYAQIREPRAPGPQVVLGTPEEPHRKSAKALRKKSGGKP